MNHCFSSLCLFPVSLEMPLALLRKHNRFWVNSFVTYCLALTPKLTALQQQQYVSPHDRLCLGTSACFVWLTHIAAFIRGTSGAVRSTMTSLTFLEVDAGC